MSKAARELADGQPTVGSVLAGRYLLEAFIARGGMGAVYRATDSFLGQAVAIKILTLRSQSRIPPEIQKALDDLRNEARTSIKLSHPNIVRSYNYERDHNWEFLVSEFVEGDNLKTLKKKSPTGKLNLDLVVQVGIQACEALEHARSMGILHFDVKPANIILSNHGIAKLCDFGLSSLASLMADPSIDRLAVGTPAFMSPEMVMARRADHRSDIYSLGATLFDLATGSPPFGRDPATCWRAHVETTVEFPSHLHTELAKILAKALSKDPESRYFTANLMRQALQGLATELQTSIDLDAEWENVKEGLTIVTEPEPNFATGLGMSDVATPGQPGLNSTLQVASIKYDIRSKRWMAELRPELDSERTLVIAVGSADLGAQAQAFADLRSAYPNSHVIGCSTAGEVINDEVLDESLSVGVLRFEHTQLRSASTEVADVKDSFLAGEGIAKQLLSQDLRCIIVLSEGLQVNGSELVRGLRAHAPEGVVVTGGMAGDGSRFSSTWVLGAGDVRPRAVVAVGLYGESLVVGHGSEGGWSEFGSERVVTRSVDNVVYDIDGTSALDLYERYLGPKASGLPATGLLFPLAMHSNADDPAQYLVRTLLGVDREEGSLTFAGDVPQGSRVRMMKADHRRLIDGARTAGRAANQSLSVRSGAFFAFVVSCVGRKLVLGADVEAEVMALQQAMPDSTETLGFYSYGEIGPHASGPCDLHNQTMTVTLLGEVPPAHITTPPVVPTAPSPATSELDVPHGMQIEQVRWDLSKGVWTPDLLPKLDSPNTLVLVFGAPEAREQPELFRVLRESYPTSTVVGCSGAGEIHGTEICDGALVVTVLRFAHTSLRVQRADVRSPSESFVVGQELGEALSSPDLQAVLLLSDGLQVNGSTLAAGITAELGDDVPVVGGLAGDGTRFESSWVCHNEQVRSGWVAAVGLYGNHLVVGHGFEGGWDPFGAERRVTRSRGNVVFEIDGQPALALYKRYLGAKADQLPASGLLFPLSLRESSHSEKFLVRTLLSVDDDAQSLTFAGDVPEGQVVQLMKADLERLIDGASGAARKGLQSISAATGATLGLAVSCVGRRLVLGDRSEEELEAVAGVLPGTTKIAGFYSYGELSPFGKGACDLHNQTMTLALLGESAEPLEQSLASPTLSVPQPRPSEGMKVERRAFDLKTGLWNGELPALDSEQTLVLAFGPPEVDHTHVAIQEVLRTYPRSTVVGCSTAGEINGTSVQDNTLSLGITQFSKTRLQPAQVEVRDARQSYAAGETLGGRLKHPDLRAVLVFSDGLGVNGSELARGFNAVLDPGIVVTGGLAGDGPRFAKTWVLSNQTVGQRVVVAVGLYGEHLEVAHGYRGGWDMFGPQRIITRSEGNVLYEIDGQPALDLYKRYLGDKSKDLPASGLRFPMALRASRDSGEFVVRTLLSVDDAEQSLTFAGDMPEGHVVQLMKADLESLVDGAQGAAEDTTRMMQGTSDSGPALAVAVSCVGRRLVLGAATDEEIEVVKEALPAQTELVGFYSYGELSPSASGQCDLHNQTMTLTVFREQNKPVARRVAPPRPPSDLSVAATRRPSSQPVPTPVPPAAPTPPRINEEPTLQGFIVTQVGDVSVARISGRITETFDARAVAARLKGQVLMDLSGVDRVTSFGVREWLQLHKSMGGQVTDLYYGRCSDAVVNQMSMIPGFAGNGKVVSFLAPFICDRCGSTFEVELDTEKDAEALSAHFAVATCARCQASASLDDDPEAYFGFAAPFIGKPVPANIRQALAGLALKPVEEVAQLEKVVSGRTTTIRVTQPLDRGLRWPRVLDGVEGDLVLDVSAVPAADEEGLRLLLQGIDGVAEQTDSISLVGVPLAYLDLLRELGRSPEMVKSVVVHVVVRGGRAPRVVRVDLDFHRAALERGEEPLILDTKTQEPLDLSSVLPLLHFAVGAQPGRTAPQQSSPEDVGAGSAASPTPRIMAGVASLGLLLLFASVLVWSRREPPKPTAGVPLVVAPSAPSEPAEPASPELPPSWTELRVIPGNGGVDFIGLGQNADLPTGLEVARHQALARFAEHVLGQIKTPYGAFLRQHKASLSLGELASRIETKYIDVAIQRVEHWVDHSSPLPNIWARYRADSAAIDALVEKLSDTESIRGMSIGHTSPMMSAPLQGVLVFDVRPRSHSGRLGLRSGDVILSINGRSVQDPGSFIRVWRTEWWRTSPGRDVVVAVQGQASRHELRFTRPKTKQ